MMFIYAKYGHPVLNEERVDVAYLLFRNKRHIQVVVIDIVYCEVIAF